MELPAAGGVLSALPQWLDPLDRWLDAAAAGIACAGLALGALTGFRRLQSCRRQAQQPLQHGEGGKFSRSQSDAAATRSSQGRRSRGHDEHEVSRRRQLDRERAEMRRRAEERKLEIERLQERKRRSAGLADVGDLLQTSDGSFISTVQSQGTAVPGLRPVAKGHGGARRDKSHSSTRHAAEAVPTERPGWPPDSGGDFNDAGANWAAAAVLDDGDGDSTYDAGGEVGEMMRQERAERERIAKEFNLPNDAICPLTLEVMRDPVVDALGHSYEVCVCVRVCVCVCMCVCVCVCLCVCPLCSSMPPARRASFNKARLMVAEVRY